VTACDVAVMLLFTIVQTPLVQLAVQQVHNKSALLRDIYGFYDILRLYNKSTENEQMEFGFRFVVDLLYVVANHRSDYL